MKLHVFIENFPFPIFCDEKKMQSSFERVIDFNLRKTFQTESQVVQQLKRFNNVTQPFVGANEIFKKIMNPLDTTAGNGERLNNDD